MNDEAERGPEGQGDTATPRPKSRGSRRWLVRIGAGFGLFVLVSGLLLAFAEHHTAQPGFCASCHIMEPYYASWEKDIHGGQLGIACVDCHYAPGERSTVSAKLRGLSQLTSYFSGRYGATRPRAHVAQESCLTSNCHGDGQFMDKELQVGTVRFRHSRHLERTDEDNTKYLARLAVLKEELGATVGTERFPVLEETARQSRPYEDRIQSLTLLSRQWGIEIDPVVLAEYTELEHRGVRIAQLQSIQCTDCHGYNTKETVAGAAHGQEHFRVQQSSCFTCHFNNQGFNVGTAECMKCHTPPRTEIAIHEQLDESLREKLGGSKLGQEQVKMDHSDIIARKIDCRSCHADVILGDSIVSRRDCERCHDQATFYADWKSPLSTTEVTRYHELHVPQQRAKCLDCHTQIRHKLEPDGGALGNGGFLLSSMTECAHCHPNHHEDQVKLLLGRGGESVPKSDPNVMFGARTNCYGCHTEHQAVNGQQVLAATVSACVACHGEEYVQTFEQWKEILETTLKDTEDAFANVNSALDAAKTMTAEQRAEALKLLGSAERDLDLIRRGKGVHNITYALQILDAVTSRCSEVEQMIPAAAPIAEEGVEAQENAVPQPEPDSP